MFRKRASHIINLLILCLFCFCSFCFNDVLAQDPQSLQNSQDSQSLQPFKDPYEKINRVTFKFNEGLDKYLIRPVSDIYVAVLPNPIRTGVDNFFSNLNSTFVILNDLLQIRIYDATTSTWRLAINSTIGVLGVFDVASHMGLQKHYNSFGLTLAQWGYKDSNYLILPVLGPFTVRDAIGFGGDFLTSVYPYIPNYYVRYGAEGLLYVNVKTKIFEQKEIYKEIIFDPYIFERNAYLQNREYLIKQKHGIFSSTIEDAEPVYYIGSSAAVATEDYYLDE
jgi:phospholipid-binding lipoprotein MlaA